MELLYLVALLSEKELHVGVADLFPQHFQTVSVLQEGAGDLGFFVLAQGQLGAWQDGHGIPSQPVLAEGTLLVEYSVEVFNHGGQFALGEDGLDLLDPLL